MCQMKFDIFMGLIIVVMEILEVKLANMEEALSNQTGTD